MTDPNIALVLDELDNAKRKHPHFVDALIPSLETFSAQWYDRVVLDKRTSLAAAVERGECYLHHILGCEGMEAFQAYAHGDLAHARQELAQCAAVCIRGMEFIEKEMTEQHTTKETTND